MYGLAEAQRNCHPLKLDLSIRKQKLPTKAQYRRKLVPSSFKYGFTSNGKLALLSKIIWVLFISSHFDSRRERLGGGRQQWKLHKGFVSREIAYEYWVRVFPVLRIVAAICTLVWKGFHVENANGGMHSARFNNSRQLIFDS